MGVWGHGVLHPAALGALEAPRGGFSRVYHSQNISLAKSSKRGPTERKYPSKRQKLPAKTPTGPEEGVRKMATKS
ncbi:hypothetical protein TCCBUS3UF1_p250 (plasmid) [Thermus sp. CCB_US3_UF1]|nr:hypothetical protein TCCBUS3UF1_p250 [Thermus sp. CCB_US3_UF1]